MLRTCIAVIAGLALAATAARAQNDHACMRLNHPTVTNAYLTVANKAGLENLLDITIEAWVRPTSYAGFPTIVGNDFTNSFWLGLSTSGKLRFYPNGTTYVESSATIPLNRWTHVAATYLSAAGLVSLVVDGELNAIAGGFSGTTGSSSAPLRIGADQSGGVPAFFWRGWLDDVRIWGIPRGLTQIRQDRYVVYYVSSANASDYYADLKAQWGFDGTRADGTYWGDGNHIATPVNGATHDESLSAPVSYGTAFTFNGSTDAYMVYPFDLDLSAGFTAEAWIYPTSWSGFPTIMGRNYETGLWFGLTTTGKLRLYPKGGIGAYFDGQTTIPLDQWTHVAAVYRNGLARLLVNGKVDAWSTAFTGPTANNSRSVYLGADDNATGTPDFRFVGRMDEARLLAGPRSPAQIRADMWRKVCSGG